MEFLGVNVAAFLGTPMIETPLFVGRSVVNFARDRRRIDKTGTVLLAAQLASRYGVRDERGVRSPSLGSVKFLLLAGVQPLREWARLAEVSTDSEASALTPSQDFVFNKLPDLPIPALSFFKML